MSYSTTNHNSPTYAVSICIPRAFHKLTWKIVKSAFETAFNAPGCVKQVDLVPRTDDQMRPFKRIFVHFDFWPDNDTANYAMERMTSTEGGTFQLVYDEPWYWKCSLSRVAPPSFQTKRSGTSVKATPFVSVVDVVASDLRDTDEDSNDGEIDEEEAFNSKMSVTEAIIDATDS